MDARVFLGDSVEVSIGYLYADSVVAENPANPALEGLRVAQVPQNQGTLRIAWHPSPGWIATAAVRATDNQFETTRTRLRWGPSSTPSWKRRTGPSVFVAGGICWTAAGRTSHQHRRPARVPRRHSTPPRPSSRPTAGRACFPSERVLQVRVAFGGNP
jgi:hypothetical protein